MTILIPGPALMVRIETSDVSLSFIVPMTFQDSDCAFTALDHRSISSDQSSPLKEKELRGGVAMASNATLLFAASTSQSIRVTISSSIPTFRNFATMSNWIRACSGEAKINELSASTIISAYTKWGTVHSSIDAFLAIIRGDRHHLFFEASNLASPLEGVLSATRTGPNTFWGASICQ